MRRRNKNHHAPEDEDDDDDFASTQLGPLHPPGPGVQLVIDPGCVDPVGVLTLSNGCRVPTWREQLQDAYEEVRLFMRLRGLTNR